MLTEVVRQDCCCLSQKIGLQKASEGGSASRTCAPGRNREARGARLSRSRVRIEIEVDIEIERYVGR